MALAPLRHAISLPEKSALRRGLAVLVAGVLGGWLTLPGVPTESGACIAIAWGQQISGAASGPLQSSLAEPASGDSPAGESYGDSRASSVDDASESETTHSQNNPDSRWTPEQLEQFATQLGAPSYHRRIVAMRHLEEAGVAAIQPLERAARSGNLEVVDRASLILQSLAVLETPADPPLAWTALERLRQDGPGSAATRADSSMEMIRGERSVRAQTRLAASGLTVGLQQLTFNSRNEVADAIIFPDAWEFDPETLKWLPWMYTTTMVILEGDTVRDETIEAVVQLPQLRDIQIRDAKLSTNALRTLAELKRINTLELLFVDVGGPEEDLDAVADLPLRRSLVLTATRFTEEDVAALEEALEGLEIIFSRGGFLGVQCYSGDVACVVRAVVADSAADRSGIRTGDIITQLGEHSISKFEDLQEAVRKHSPNEPMNVKIQRGGEKQEIQVELGRL